MAQSFINVNFYGHDQPELSGLPAGEAPTLKLYGNVALRTLRRQLSFKAVGMTRDFSGPYPNTVPSYNYNAVLGPPNEGKTKALAETLVSKLKPGANPIFLVTGYSAGGVTALWFGRAINRRRDATLGYIGLSEAAFYEPDSGHLMRSPGAVAKYRKNYFQTKGNAPDVAEIHGPVAFFSNFNLDGEITGDDVANLHEQALVKGNLRMTDDVAWCVGNYVS